MYILGINAYHGDSSACILEDGKLIAASEEERFRRIKHWAGFPSQAIKFCLDEAGVDITDVDYITVSRDPWANVHKKVWHSAKNLVKLKNLKDRVTNLKKVTSIKEQLSQALNVQEKSIRAEVKYIEHHRSHMASAFFVSPFEEAAILSIDGFGDFTSTMIGTGKKHSIDVLDSVIYPHSSGLFYTTFTQYLGFPKYGDEYKVMGLAPYGNPVYVDKLKDVLKFTDSGLFELSLDYFNHTKEGVSMTWEGGSPHIDPLFSDYLVEVFGPARKANQPLEQKHKDMAASIQRITEELIFHILNSLHKRTGIDYLCIAGGVAQNSVANGKVLNNTPFKELYIPSAGHDAGTSSGSALFLYHQILDHSRSEAVYNASTGSQFTNEEIEFYLNSEGIPYRKVDEDKLFGIVADRVIDAGVIGWFQGRAEFGPRALGNRSILVDPRRKDAKDLLNDKIKRRESFRPFAPSILLEYAEEYFEIRNGDKVPFMEKVYPIKKEKHKVIPAVTHVDGTGRLQTVDGHHTPRYHRLIDTFREKTGVPVLLNTSFNENEPIVNTPAEALDCFLRTQMDMLVMENIVVERKNGDLVKD